MLVWAFRYLAIAVVVAALFGYLQDSEWLKGGRASPGPRRDIKVERLAAPADAALEQVIRAGPHGHFLVDGMANGVPIRFLIDTGASDIVLNPSDARRLGFDASNLRFSRQYETANGMVRGAPVTLRELRVGQLHLFDVEASVNEAPLEVSLLGMSFLNELSGYEVARGRLILRW